MLTCVSRVAFKDDGTTILIIFAVTSGSVGLNVYSEVVEFSSLQGAWARSWHSRVLPCYGAANTLVLGFISILMVS